MIANEPDAEAARDYAAAMHEVASNLEVRRLMLVVANVLTPTLLMAVSDCLSGANYEAAAAWLPGAVLPLAGALLLGSGVLVTGVLGRCHYGLVVNGTKMQKVETGNLRLQSLNWLGVTTNFVLLTAVSSGLGATFLTAGLGWGTWALPVGAVMTLLLLAWLPFSHRRANRLCRQLDRHWQPGVPPAALREQHARKTLEGTTSDISVVVVMAVALFAGAFNAITNLGAVPNDLAIEPQPRVLKATGFTLLAAFLFASLLLSCRMLVRLRLALGDYSVRLATVRGEEDVNALRFRPQERTFLLYGIVLVLAAASALLLGWERAGRGIGMLSGAVVAAAGIVWYPLRVTLARRRG